MYKKRIIITFIAISHNKKIQPWRLASHNLVYIFKIYQKEKKIKNTKKKLLGKKLLEPMPRHFSFFLFFSFLSFVYIMIFCYVLSFTILPIRCNIFLNISARHTHITKYEMKDRGAITRPKFSFLNFIKFVENRIPIHLRYTNLCTCSLWNQSEWQSVDSSKSYGYIKCFPIYFHLELYYVQHITIL